MAKLTSSARRLSPNGPLRFNHMAQGLVSVFDIVTRGEVTASQAGDAGANGAAESESGRKPRHRRAAAPFPYESERDSPGAEAKAGLRWVVDPEYQSRRATRCR
jgi:hypothetical protein